jgi:hypothetical protein
MSWNSGRCMSGAICSMCLLAIGASLRAQGLPGTSPQDRPASNVQTKRAPPTLDTNKTDALDPATQVSPQSPPVPAAGDPLYAPLATGRQNPSQKFMDYAIVTIGPRALVGPALSSAITMARPPSGYPRDWTDGGAAFGRNYGSILARNASLRTGRYLTGALLHEDFRYRPSNSKNPVVRSFHAIELTFVDKSDSGHSRIALANFVGAASGGFVGQLYLPHGYNDLSHAESDTVRLFAGVAAQNLLREFAPDIRKVTRKLHVPFPRIPVPDWWTPR